MDKTNIPEDFSCRGCGSCCRWPGHVLLTQDDITAISASLGLNENEFIQHHTVVAENRSQLSLVEHAGGACCFLSSDNKCRIYNARPQQCRDFPQKWHVSGCPVLDSASKLRHRPD